MDERSLWTKPYMATVATTAGRVVAPLVAVTGSGWGMGNVSPRRVAPSQTSWLLALAERQRPQAGTFKHTQDARSGRQA